MTKNLTLSELQLLIRDSIYLSLPDFYWVVAEISEIKQNSSGHCYLELIEKRDDETNLKARVKAVIWNNRYGFIKAFFENATGETLRAGLKVLLKTQVEYHELYGLSLVITDIDPSFTIGEMAARRLAIIRRLEDEGVYNMNKELELPLVPQRIAIISSSSAAGYRDFINHLKNNAYGYTFSAKLFESSMQGEQNEQGMINALYNIEQVSEQFDVVVIIRGGGSQADLAWFDNYNIAYHVTQFPLPVITGIGHDKDLTVTDLVACKSVKTPTAAADLIIELTAETEDRLLELGDNIKTLAQEYLWQFRKTLELSEKKLMPLANLILSELKRKMSETSHRFIRIIGEQTYKTKIKTEKLKLRLSSITMANIKNRYDKILVTKILLTSSVRKLIKKEEKRITMLTNTLDILNPENVLKRGYTITYQNGKVIKDSRNLETNDIIDTLFIDGLIKSKITEKNNAYPPLEGAGGGENTANNQNYNKNLRDKAHSLRYSMTKAEACLWKYALRAGMMKGYTFNRQRPIGNYIVDFVCKELKLVIEIDGFSHLHEETKNKDNLKEEYLIREGFRILRFEDNEILKDMRNVIRVIENEIEDILPLPPPEGDKFAFAPPEGDNLKFHTNKT